MIRTHKILLMIGVLSLMVASCGVFSSDSDKKKTPPKDVSLRDTEFILERTEQEEDRFEMGSSIFTLKLTTEEAIIEFERGNAENRGHLFKAFSIGSTSGDTLLSIHGVYRAYPESEGGLIWTVPVAVVNNTDTEKSNLNSYKDMIRFPIRHKIEGDTLYIRTAWFGDRGWIIMSPKTN